MKRLTIKAMARLGGLARAKKLSKARRSEIARQAVLTRWRKRATQAALTKATGKGTK
mgnify:CR=1 FL=1